LPKANYITLLKKLKKDFIESTLSPLDKNSKKDHQTYCLIDSQLCLLDVYEYKGYNDPPTFASSMEVNQFVDSYVMRKSKFLEDQNKMSITNTIPSPSTFVIQSYFAKKIICTFLQSTLSWLWTC
jgi:hypothetical protein